MIFKNIENLPGFYNVYNILKPLSNSYPEFDSWFWDKVVPGVSLGDDKIIVAETKNSLVGVSIIKSTDTEKKLRALRISDEFQKKGYGLYLIDESLKQLNFDKPIISVSEEMINDYSRIFINRYNFNISHVYKGLYRKNKLEYEFNGKNVDLKNKSIYF
jgi:hypothetical protein